MNLLIEHGQLLKPYSLPWSSDGWAIPDGWTPERTPEMHRRVMLIVAENPDDLPDFKAWEQVERDEGERREVARRPWPGWVMVPSPFSAKATKTDKRISRAYRELYSRLNEKYSEFIDVGLRPPAGVKLAQVPDGRYVFRKGKMILMDKVNAALDAINDQPANPIFDLSSLRQELEELRDG